MTYQEVKEEAIKDLLETPQKKLLAIWKAEKQYKTAFNRVLAEKGAVTNEDLHNELLRMKKEKLVIGTKVYLRINGEMRECEVIVPTRELHDPESIMVRVPMTFTDGTKLVDIETSASVLCTVEEKEKQPAKCPRIYISGPISGRDKGDCEARFQRAEYELISKGYKVFNPLKNGLQYDDATSKHMRRDLNELTREDNPYDAIYMMKDWNHSAGCWTEFKVATTIGLQVYFEFTGDIVRIL